MTFLSKHFFFLLPYSQFFSVLFVTGERVHLCLQEAFVNTEIKTKTHCYLRGVELYLQMRMKLKKL